MIDKTTQIREYILTQLETGSFRGGDKLPGARELGKIAGASFVIVQQALASLVRDGILETMPRLGTYVRREWDSRVLDKIMSVYSLRLPWLPGAEDILHHHLPWLRVSRTFKRGAFELLCTVEVQQRQHEFLDLAELLHDVYPDDNVFFRAPFRSFYNSSGALIGVPFIFSPRVIFYNHKVLERAGVPCPDSNWRWDEFIDTIKLLKRSLPGNQIYNWNPHIVSWMNYVFRAGGTLLDPDALDPVKIDDERTRLGLRLYTELGRLLEVDDNCPSGELLRGDLAFQLGPRELLCDFKHAGFDSWRTVSLPHIPGGSELSAQATDLICVRKDYVDLDAVRDLLRVMLSEEMQDYIGAEKFGIPIRKSSAFKSIDLENPCDAIFMAELSRMSAEYNLDSPELVKIVSDGIQQIWTRNADIDVRTAELANVVRTFMAIRKAGNVIKSSGNVGNY